jgi:hypothetical protein
MKGILMSRDDDDRRYEQRRLDRIADEHRYEQRRRDYLADERRREQGRCDWIAEENRRQDRADRDKGRQETKAGAIAWLPGGNAEAVAALGGLGDHSARVARVAPTLTVEPGPEPGVARLGWTGGELPGAWVLQAAGTKGFADAVEEYRGPEARQLVPRPDSAPRWYRVRREGWSGGSGPWSDAARLDPPRPQAIAASRSSSPTTR